MQIYQKDSQKNADGQVKKKKRDPPPPIYFYIQRTTSANEVLLVRGGEDTVTSTKTSKSNGNSLFAGSENSHPPVGYRLRNFTYLFDSILGCVYRLEHKHDFKLLPEDSPSQNTIKLRRTNIPFERFFRCDSDLFPIDEKKFAKRWPSNRCDHNYIGSGGKGNGSLDSGGEDDDGGGFFDGSWKMIWTLFGGGLLFLLLLLSLCIACFSMFCCGKCLGKAHKQQDGLKGKKKTSGSISSSSSFFSRTNNSFVPYFHYSSGVSSTGTSSAFFSSSPKSASKKSKSPVSVLVSEKKTKKHKTKSRSPNQHQKPISALNALAESVEQRGKVVLPEKKGTPRAGKGGQGRKNRQP